ncbi:L-lactate dehydrogenase [Lactobacillus delbrueckii subsp. bulgaricus]|nr:L-lactate dehydrogenase [Lactobacillus delbrueckii subsp. bulgaricus]MBT8944889.1 L-lactate dehydrogenase [Lactobacillus delbrueckii subsp. bulgaricus]MBT8946470.1 L-lactate dehydrogenase [Lactobacillus delbrueckii subsp. bulgaricus]MBT8950724.1 L-lactate dehydrogenase [Lactobacillus delbrueckii subsp. bulgaricus]MBT8954389.1 L-lactate dehydrogenase [Lactobacillus delbrueckii subsp. bulgaricus]
MSRKVLLVGDGAVGSNFANDLLQTTRVDELVICDLNKDRAAGDCLDLEDMTYFTGQTKLRAGDYSDAADADVVVITAGLPRKPGESRLDLIKKNEAILRSIVDPVVASGFSGIFVVSANPVDILTTLTQKLSGFPKKRVIGTGTSLDSARLRVELAKRLQVPIESVNAWVLGEHGDSSFENFSSAVVNGKPLLDYPGMTEAALDEIEAHVREKGSEIIVKKGATYYGVAMMLAKIVTAILENNDLALPLSAPLHGEYGIKDEIYLGTLAIINGQGISHVLELPLNDSELAKMRASAATIKATLDSLG